MNESEQSGDHARIPMFDASVGPSQGRWLCIQNSSKGVGQAVEYLKRSFDASEEYQDRILPGLKRSS